MVTPIASSLMWAISLSISGAIQGSARWDYGEFEPGLVVLILRGIGHRPSALRSLWRGWLEIWRRRAHHTLTLNGHADATMVYDLLFRSTDGSTHLVVASQVGTVRVFLLHIDELLALVEIRSVTAVECQAL